MKNIHDLDIFLLRSSICSSLLVLVHALLIAPIAFPLTDSYSSRTLPGHHYGPGSLLQVFPLQMDIGEVSLLCSQSILRLHLIS